MNRPTGQGRVGASIATLAVCAVVIALLQGWAMDRDQDRAVLGVQLQKQIEDLHNFSAPRADSAFRARAARWLPLARRNPESALAWELSEASLDVEGAIVGDPSAQPPVGLRLVGDVDALGLGEPRLLLISVGAGFNGDVSHPVCWSAMRSDSGDTRWYHEVALDALSGEHSVRLDTVRAVSLACTTWVLPAGVPETLDWQLQRVRPGPVPRAWVSWAESRALRRHVRRQPELPFLEVAPPAPSTTSRPGS